MKMFPLQIFCVIMQDYLFGGNPRRVGVGVGWVGAGVAAVPAVRVAGVEVSTRAGARPAGGHCKGNC